MQLHHFQHIARRVPVPDNFTFRFVPHINAQKSRVQDLCRILRYTTNATVEMTQSLPSEQSVLIQLADVLTGVVSSAFNDDNETKESKREVRSHVERYLGHKIIATPPSEQKFNVFDINLRKGW